MVQSDPRVPRSRSAAEEETRRLWRLAGMGGTLASEIAAGALIGWLLDLWLDTAPTLVIVCTIAGVVVGMATFIRSALAASKESERDATRIAAHLHEHAARARQAAKDAHAKDDIGDEDPGR